MEQIELTRAEIDALNKYDQKRRLETIKTIFDVVEELLESNKKLERYRAEISQSYVGDQMHQYGERLCVSLLVDLQIIRKKYEEEEG